MNHYWPLFAEEWDGGAAYRDDLVSAIDVPDGESQHRVSG